uniref:Uncharacterized protein n=1 Tax=Leersia perrieri TaxID=77586 RepID=A0A0D9X8S9_9ORYZ
MRSSRKKKRRDESRKNKIRKRTEANQVYSAEEKRALAAFSFEQRAMRESKPCGAPSPDQSPTTQNWSGTGQQEVMVSGAEEDETKAATAFRDSRRRNGGDGSVPEQQET